MQVFSEPELTQQHHQQQQQLNNSNNTSSSMASHQHQHQHHAMQQQEQALVLGLDRRDSYPELVSQGGGDNTYATIQPRNYASNLSSVLMGTSGIGGGGGVSQGGGGGTGGGPAGGLSGEMSDYATLRNSRAPSVSVGLGGVGLLAALRGISRKNVFRLFVAL